MRAVFLLACLFGFVNMQAQHKDRGVDAVLESTVYRHVDRMPKPAYDFNEYFMKNFPCDDTSLKNAGGRIVVKFIVNEDGTISNCSIVKGNDLADEALKVVRKMPKWESGIQNGKQVKVWYELPINICLKQ